MAKIQSVAYFSANTLATKLFFGKVDSMLPKDQDIIILDIGCGTGGLLKMFAEKYPDGCFIGVDFSEDNINAAKEATKYGDHNFIWHHADYLRVNIFSVPVILSASALHLIDGKTTDLVDKLSKDLQRGGVLFISMPYGCLYNDMLNLFRRSLLFFRSPFFDNLIVKMGQMIYKNKSRQFFEDRLLYMYLPISRFYDKQFKSMMQSCGIHVIHEEPHQHASLFQPKHKFIVFQKASKND